MLLAVFVVFVAAWTSEGRSIDRASLRVTVGVRRQSHNVDKMEELFWAVSDVGHPLYGKHLTQEETRALRAAHPTELEQVQRWLVSSGCVDVSVLGSRDAVDAMCPSRPTPTDHIDDLVDYVYSRREAVHRGPHQPAVQRLRERRQPLSLGQAWSGQNNGTPARQREFYGMPSTLRSTNASNLQMVWGCGTFGVNLSELAMYDEKYCPECPMANVQFDTSHHGHEPGDNFDEGTLDTTYITSFGMGVRTIVSNTNTSSSTEEGDGQGAATVYFMESLADRPAKDLPLVLSLSLGSITFGACDQLCKVLASTTSHTYTECYNYLQDQRQVCLYATARQQDRINTAFKTLGLRGTTVLGASGDGGPHWSFGPFSPGTEIGKALTRIGCRRMSPLFPASSPYILAVGGITWVNDDPASPVAWNQHEGSTGGGFSDVWPMPQFQKSTVAEYFQRVSGQPGVPPKDQYVGTNRAYPDVAAFMDGVPLCIDGRCEDSICGGTSASTPTVAGILSLVNDARLNKGLSPLGFVVPRIWQTAQEYPGEAFTDITAAANTSTGCATYFPAAEGWDPQTGWGYPHWPGLLKHLGTDSALPRTQAEQ